MEEYSKQVSAWYNRVLETAFLTTHSDFVYVIRIFFVRTPVRGTLPP